MCAVDLSREENAVKHIDRKEIGNYNTQRLKGKGFGRTIFIINNCVPMFYLF